MRVPCRAAPGEPAAVSDPSQPAPPNPPRRRRLLPALLGTLLLAIALLAGGLRLAHQRLLAPGPLARATDVVVPHGSLEGIAVALQRAGVIREPLALRAAAWWTRGEGPLHAGEFRFPAHASLRESLTVLRTARPVQHHLTIPEGLTARQIAALVGQAPALDGTVATPPEGAVLPETYAYERGTTRAALIARAEHAMDKALAAAWAGRDKALPLDTPRQLLTLASMVERETARPEERPMVAAVFLNRLRRGMRLQSDPTVVYAASHGEGVLDRKLTRADLELDSPYNTYRIAGLPPGPIASPGRASLEAAAHPADSDALYFVADGSGGHAFANTLAEHNRNVAKWRALEEGKGK